MKEINTLKELKEELKLSDKDLDDAVQWLSGKGRKFPMPKLFLQLQKAEGQVKNGWTPIGVVGVDSGQLMVCDPCYLHSEWSDTKLNYANMLKVVATGKEIPSPRKIGKTYEDEYEKGLTYNQAIAQGILKEVPEQKTGEFSYDGCCKETINDYGQLNYKLGHAGAGVVFNSGFGDGCYPVYAKIKDFGKRGLGGKRIAEVKIVMIEEE